MSPKLSICMPTYNRSRLLERAVASVGQLRDLGVDLELVISDNASTDDTPAVIAELSRRYPFIRGFRNSRNFGSIINYQLCLRRARGAFALYLADDDTLIVEEVLTVLKTMEARPDLAMAVLSFQFWDEEKGSGTVWPNLPDPVVIGHNDFAGAFLLLFNDIMLPEIVMMRRRTIDSIVAERLDAYYAHVQFAHGLRDGNVWLHHRPAYRFHMTNQDGMDTAGWNLAVGAFEEYRAGLEYCLLQWHRATPLEAAVLDDYKRQIETYIQRRMLQAAHRLSRRNEHQKAAGILQRLQLWARDPAALAQLRALLERVAPLACAESIAFLAREAFAIEYLAVHNDRDDPLFAAITAEVLAMTTLSRITLGEAIRQGVQARTLVLAQREDLIPPTAAAGFPLPQIVTPGQMMKEFTEMTEPRNEAAA